MVEAKVGATTSHCEDIQLECNHGVGGVGSCILQTSGDCDLLVFSMYFGHTRSKMKAMQHDDLSTPCYM
jgi:hypothetical protein